MADKKQLSRAEKAVSATKQKKSATKKNTSGKTNTKGKQKAAAQVSTESVPVAQIRSVVLGYMYSQPQNYKPSDQARELTLAIAWSGGQRLDMGPAGCADPQCEADHGYTGTIAQEDIVLRVSAEADGIQAVQNAKAFARALRKVNTDTMNVRAMDPAIDRQRMPGIGGRFNRGHHQR